jgi:hypothetical protein
MRPAEAEPILLEAQSNLERILGPDHEHTRGVAWALSGAMRGLGRPDEAAAWKARSTQRK